MINNNKVINEYFKKGNYFFKFLKDNILKKFNKKEFIFTNKTKINN